MDFLGNPKASADIWYVMRYFLFGTEKYALKNAFE